MKSTSTHLPRKSVKLTCAPDWVSSVTPGTCGGCRRISTRRAASLVNAWKPSVAVASATPPMTSRVQLASHVRRVDMLRRASRVARDRRLEQATDDAGSERKHAEDHQYRGNRSSLVIGQPFRQVYREAPWHAHASGVEEGQAEGDATDDVERQAALVDAGIACRLPMAAGHVIQQRQDHRQHAQQQVEVEMPRHPLRVVHHVVDAD